MRCKLAGKGPDVDEPARLLADHTFRQTLESQVAGAQAGTLLRSLKIKLLSNCNLRCVMCRYWRIPRRSLPLDVVCRTLDDAAALGCRKVHLSGGEVTLYKQLNTVIAHAARSMRVNLTTNGVVLDRPRVRRWMDNGLHAVSISLDGATAATHDAIRGVRGAFDQSIKGIRNLVRERERRGMRLRLRINTVVSRKNLAEQPNLIRLAAELGATDVVPMPVDGASADRPAVEEILAYNMDIAPELARLRRRYGFSVSDDRIYLFGRTSQELALAAMGNYALGYYERHLCYAPYLHTFVSHLGDVFACCMTAERMPSLGNVYTRSLTEIFTGPEYEHFRRMMSQQRHEMCAHCDQFLPENRLLNEVLGSELNSPPVVRESVRVALPMILSI